MVSGRLNAFCNACARVSVTDEPVEFAAGVFAIPALAGICAGPGNGVGKGEGVGAGAGAGADAGAGAGAGAGTGAGAGAGAGTGAGAGAAEFVIMAMISCLVNPACASAASCDNWSLVMVITPFLI